MGAVCFGKVYVGRDQAGRLRQQHRSRREVWVRGPGGKASVSVSALYQTLKIRDEPEERNAAFALEPRYKWSSGATRFAAGIYYQADADDAKSYKLDSDIKLTYMITNVLGLSAEFESRYRNITSGEGVDKLDTTTSIGVTFVY